MGARHFLTRLRALFRGQRLRDEIRDEFEFHIEQRTLQNVRRGLSPEDARRSAERAFGRRTQLMEAAYDVRGGGAWLEAVAFDLRYAARRLWHQPGFTIPAVTILVFGIAANTVLFSVLSSALLSRPPVPAAENIVRVYSGRSVAFPTYLALADASRSELALAAYAQRPLSIRFGAGYAERVAGELVSDNYFEMLRVAPVEGRLWARQPPSEHSVPVVLSETLARRMSPTASLAGSDVWINGEPGIVVGIVPATFTGSNPGFRASAWVPIQSLPALRSRLTDQGDRWLNMIGRLASGVSSGRAQARLTAISADQRAAREDAFRVQPATGLAVAPDSRAPFLASLAAVTAVMIVVLLVAASSVGGLLLARSMGARARDGVAACARRESGAHRAADSLRDTPPRAAFGCRLGAARDEGRPGDGGAHTAGLRATRARDACDQRRGAVHHGGRVYCRRSVRAPAGASVVGGRRPQPTCGISLARRRNADVPPRCWSSDRSRDP